MICTMVLHFLDLDLVRDEMKNIHHHIFIILIIGTSFFVGENVYGCTYCPAIQSKLDPNAMTGQPQQTVPSIVWEILVVGAVISSWIIIFRLLKKY